MERLNLRMRQMDQLWISFPQERPRRGGEEAWELSPSNDIDISLNNDLLTMIDGRIESFKRKKGLSKRT